ncbi:MAG: peptidoglycan DD-metalloendopeptidase family protein [Clostridia bacterium]|nr:peptidoglycan DD-metalloendopeptidase family protein [Clostridia bacterium]
MSKKVIAMLLALMTLVSSTGAYAAKSVNQLKEELSQNQKNAEKTQKEIKAKQAEQNEHKKKKNAIDLEIASLQGDIDTIQNVIDEKDAEIEAKNAEIEVLDESLKKTDKQLKKRMKIMYESGTTSYLEMIFSAKGLSDLFTRLSIIESIVKHDNKIIEDYQMQIDQIAAAKEIIETEKNEQVEAREILEGKRGQIKAKQAEQQKLIDALSKDINELKKQEAEMEAAERQIQAQINAALGKSDQKGLTYTGNGKFILPLASYTRISSPFGYRIHPITGTRKLHSGIDYAAPAGTAIYAAEDGVVLTSGWINGYGYTITINHGSGYVTLYAHCSSLIAKAGQKVTKGQTIARVGSTGNSTGNHLHFEVKVNGSAQDPAKFL